MVSVHPSVCLYACMHVTNMFEYIWRPAYPSVINHVDMRHGHQLRAIFEFTALAGMDVTDRLVD